MKFSDLKIGQPFIQVIQVKEFDKDIGYVSVYIKVNEETCIELGWNAELTNPICDVLPVKLG